MTILERRAARTDWGQGIDPETALEKGYRLPETEENEKVQAKGRHRTSHGHLKKNFRMQQNYLMDEKAPKINAMPAATGWNLKKLMEILVEDLLYGFFKWVEYILKIQCLKLK